MSVEEQSPVVDSLPTETDIVVIGAGPAGSSAAAWAARSGRDVVLVDAAVFPRDKTCGDGLTPRAVAELDLLGLGEWVRSHTTNKGLRLSGFGQELELEWPGTSFPPIGSAIPGPNSTTPFAGAPSNPARSWSRAPRLSTSNSTVIE